MKSELKSAALRKAQAYKTPDPERQANASRELAEVQIRAAVERALAKAPPLTPAQITRLSGLLRTGGQR